MQHYSLIMSVFVLRQACSRSSYSIAGGNVGCLDGSAGMLESRYSGYTLATSVPPLSIAEKSSDNSHSPVEQLLYEPHSRLGNKKSLSPWLNRSLVGQQDSTCGEQSIGRVVSSLLAFVNQPCMVAPLCIAGPRVTPVPRFPVSYKSRWPLARSPETRGILMR
jgi:hypothetical protein